jgi:hypothetical protein
VIQAGNEQVAAQSGSFAIGGDLDVHRLGLGAMRLTGDGIWGEPEDPVECQRVSAGRSSSASR